jgi:hypothetical protein
LSRFCTARVSPAFGRLARSEVDPGRLLSSSCHRSAAQSDWRHSDRGAGGSRAAQRGLSGGAVETTLHRQPGDSARPRAPGPGFGDDRAAIGVGRAPFGTGVAGLAVPRVPREGGARPGGSQMPVATTKEAPTKFALFAPPHGPDPARCLALARTFSPTLQRLSSDDCLGRSVYPFW